MQGTYKNRVEKGFFKNFQSFVLVLMEIQWKNSKFIIHTNICYFEFSCSGMDFFSCEIKLWENFKKFLSFYVLTLFFTYTLENLLLLQLLRLPDFHFDIKKLDIEEVERYRKIE